MAINNISLRLAQFCCINTFCLEGSAGKERPSSDLHELLQSRYTGKNSINQYKSILYCSYNMFRSSRDHHEVLIHVHHATITLANVLHAICLLMQVFIK
jgi:hypothetical protein